MLENLDVNKTLQTLMALYALNIGHQFYQGYKMSQLDERVAQQLKGVFDEKAQALLKPLNDRLQLAEAEIASEQRLREEADKTLQSYSRETQEGFKEFIEKTDARISSITTNVGSISAKIEGFKIKRPTKKTTPPPKKSWKGVTAKDLKTCHEHYDPAKCGAFEIEVEHPQKNRQGESIMSFMIPNIWEGSFGVSLNLDYHIDVIGFTEENGIAENKSVLFQIGYYKGDTFFPLEDFNIQKGDNSGLDKHLFEPRQRVGRPVGLSMFDTSFLAGVVFSPISVSGSSLDFRTGLSLNVGMLNFKRGEIRLGANAVLSPDVLGGGVFSSYHLKLFGRRLNVAPTLGVLYDSQFRSALQIGLISEVW